MFNNVKEIHPLIVSGDNCKLFNKELQFDRHLLFNNGFYIKHREHVLYLTCNTSNFSPLSVVLPEGDYKRILEDFNKFINLKLLLSTSNSQVILCKQEKITDVSFDIIYYLIYCIDECFKFEEEKYIMHDVLSKFLFYIKYKNQDNIEGYVTQLIGVGKGLTPDFDDLLVGMLWAFDAFDNKYKIFKKLIRLGLKRKNTTSISNAFYFFAFDNNYAYSLVRLGEAVRNRNLFGIRDTINEIKCYGHTSGKYLLYGIFIGLNIVNHSDMH